MSASLFLEAAMVLCFGASWPMSIYKSWKSGSTRGKSLLFLLLIDLGYALGIAGKWIGGNVNYTFVFYVLNFLMVLCDICLYFRNRARERAGQAPRA